MRGEIKQEHMDPNGGITTSTDLDNLKLRWFLKNAKRNPWFNFPQLDALEIQRDTQRVIFGECSNPIPPYSTPPTP